MRGRLEENELETKSGNKKVHVRNLGEKREEENEKRREDNDEMVCEVMWGERMRERERKEEMERE